MKEFFMPDTIKEAAELKGKYGSCAIWIGGGTKIGHPLYKRRFDTEKLISLDMLGLDEIKNDKGTVVIGAKATIQQIIDCRFVPDFIKKAAFLTGPRPLRNMSTIAGQIGAGFGDSPIIAVMTALKAKLETYNGTINIDEYIKSVHFSAYNNETKCVDIDFEKQNLIIEVNILPIEGFCNLKVLKTTDLSRPFAVAAVYIPFKGPPQIAVGGAGRHIFTADAIADKVRADMTQDKIFDIAMNLLPSFFSGYQRHSASVAISRCF